MTEPRGLGQTVGLPPNRAVVIDADLAARSGLRSAFAAHKLVIEEHRCVESFLSLAATGPAIATVVVIDSTLDAGFAGVNGLIAVQPHTRMAIPYVRPSEH